MDNEEKRSPGVKGGEGRKWETLIKKAGKKKKKKKKSERG